MDRSYDYQNLVRDLSDVLNTVIQQEPTLISLVQTGGEPATNTKHEWLEDVLAPERDALAAAVSDGSTTSMTVNTGDKFAPGMVIAFEGYDELCLVSSISGNTLTVQRGYGGSSAGAIANGTEVLIVSRPRPEGTDPGDDKGRQPATEYNYTEIFDATAKVSRTAQVVRQYGIENALDYQVQNHARIIARRMNNALIYGRRVARTASVNGSMGGVLQFVGASGGNVMDAAGQDLTATILNDAIEQVVRDGGRPNILIANTNQARKISGFNASNLQVQREDQAAGNVVYRFVNDLPMGVITQIVVDMNFPKNKIGILDTTRIRLVPLKNSALSDEDATPKGADYFARRILGEYTAEIKNAKEAHGLITNLAV